MLESARKSHGVERLDQVKHATLERDETVSIIPNADGVRPLGLPTGRAKARPPTGRA